MTRERPPTFATRALDLAEMQAVTESMQID